MRNQRLYVKDILKAISLIEDFIGDMGYEEFITDPKTQSAVIRQFEIVGEAVKKLDNQLTEKYPDIDWKAISGMRDLLIHQYFGVDLDIVWESFSVDLPLFKNVMESIEKEMG